MRHPFLVTRRCPFLRHTRFPRNGIPKCKSKANSFIPRFPFFSRAQMHNPSICRRAVCPCCARHNIAPLLVAACNPHIAASSQQEVLPWALNYPPRSVVRCGWARVPGFRARTPQKRPFARENARHFCPRDAASVAIWTFNLLSARITARAFCRDFWHQARRAVLRLLPAGDLFLSGFWNSALICWGWKLVFDTVGQWWLTSKNILFVEKILKYP